MGFKGGGWATVAALAYYPERGQGWCPVLSLSAPCTLTGEQTKALVTQLTLFNQILVELRDDIRDQVYWAGEGWR